MQTRQQLEIDNSPRPCPGQRFSRFSHASLHRDHVYPHLRREALVPERVESETRASLHRDHVYPYLRREAFVPERVESEIVQVGAIIYYSRRRGNGG